MFGGIKGAGTPWVGVGGKLSAAFWGTLARYFFDTHAINLCASFRKSNWKRTETYNAHIFMKVHRSIVGC